MSENTLLVEAGLKITIPRLEILGILEDSKYKHMSSEDIYKVFVERGVNIGITTIYRILTQFEASGIVSRNRFDTDSFVFELCTEDRHDHLVCNKCKNIVNFVDHNLEKRQITLAKQFGFEITNHNLTVYGLCASCQKSN